MSPEKRADLHDAIGNLVDREDKSVSPSPSNGSEGEGSPWRSIQQKSIELLNLLSNYYLTFYCAQINP